jgi:uncharacterized membrane protein
MSTADPIKTLDVADPEMSMTSPGSARFAQLSRRAFVTTWAVIAIAAAWLGAIGLAAVPADAKSAKIAQLATTLTVGRDGSVEVREESTWKFSGGDFSRVRRPLKLNPGQSLVSYSIGEQTAQGFVPYSSGVMGTRTPGTFAVVGAGNYYEIEIYYSASSGESRTFVISYVVSGAVIAYQDVADLKWTWVGAENDVEIDRLIAKATIPPSNIALDEFRVWGHGPLQGKVTRLSNSEAEWEVRGIRPNTLVDGRMVFPSTLLPDVPRVNRSGLDQILAEEKAQADEANRQRAKARAKLVGGLVVVAFSVLLWLLLFFTYGREYRPSVRPIYERDIPSRLPPAVVGYLWNMGVIKPEEVTATLLDCVRRGFLRIEPGGTYDPGLFQSERNDYRFVWAGTPKEPGDQLRPYETNLVQLLLAASPATPGVSTQSAFEAMAKANTQTMRKFFTDFQEQVKSEAETMGLIEKRSVGMASIGMLLGVATVTSGIFLLGWPLVLVAMAVGVIEALASPLLKRRSRKGRDEYERWKAFERFLKDFSIMHERIPTEIALWERYLVYAVPLGVADEVMRQMPVYLPPEQQQALAASYGYGYYGGHTAAGGDFSSFISSFTTSFNTAISTSASSSGAGGGFSSGGGGGGGGGGYSAD